MRPSILHGGGLTQAAMTHGGRIEDWLDLSTGINPNPVCLPDIPVSAWHRLPDDALVAQARNAARHFYQSGETLPLPVPGTQSYIQMLPGLVDGSRRVAILSPTYGEYSRVFANAGFLVDEITDIDELDQDHAALVVANPNNPDGRVLQPERLLAIADRMARRNGKLIVDEAFGDCRPELSLVGEAGQHPGLIVSRSFGKFFGLAGLRLGFIIAKDEVLEAVASALGPWPVSGPALHIASRMMAMDRDFIAETLRERRRALDEVLGAAGLDVIGGTELFALVENPQASSIHAQLAGSQILIRKFGYNAEWLRFGLTPDRQGDGRLARALGL